MLRGLFCVQPIVVTSPIDPLMDRLGCDALAASPVAGPLIGGARKSGLLRGAKRILVSHPLRSRLWSVASGLIAMSLGVAPSLPARSEIVATAGRLSLGTVVNGAGACSSGHCQISGGTRRGNNLFHRFDQFDTREISGVTLSNGSATDVIMAVIGGSRAQIASPVVVEGSKASLYFLSPKGVSVLRGAGFANVDSLVLTTAGRIRLGAGATFFDYAATTDLSAADFKAAPASDLGFMRANLQEGVSGDGGGAGYFSDEDIAGGIQIASGVTLAVDKSLVIVANRAPIVIDGTTEATRLEASGSVAAPAYGDGDGLAIVGQSPSSTNFSARIKAYGLGCFPGDCGLPEERSFRDPSSGALVSLRRLGRPAIFYQDPANPLNPENYGDYTNSGEAGEAGRGVYAGMDLENIRFFVGAPSGGAGADGLASARIKLEIGNLGGAKASNLLIQAADASVISELAFGNNNERQALPSGGPSQTLFLNNQAYAAGDTSMYWFPSSDGFGTNSIRFISVGAPGPDNGSFMPGSSGGQPPRPPQAQLPSTQAPQPPSSPPPSQPRPQSQVRPQSSSGSASRGSDAAAAGAVADQPSPVFDNVLLNVDQNVAEDFEATSVQSASTPSVVSRQVNLAPGVSLSLGLAVDESPAPSTVSPSGSEAGVSSDSPDSDESRKAKPR